MKRKIKILFLLCGILNMSSIVEGQDNLFGLDISTGVYGFNTKQYYYKTFGKTEQSGSTYGIGLIYERRFKTPNNSSIQFHMRSGLSYFNLSQFNYEMGVLRLPLNFNLGLGKTWKFQVGTGIHLDFMLNHQGWESMSDFNSRVNITRFGMNIQIGASRVLSEKQEIRIYVKRFSDISTIIENYSLTQISEPTLISKTIGIGTVVSLQYVFGI